MTHDLEKIRSTRFEPDLPQALGRVVRLSSLVLLISMAHVTRSGNVWAQSDTERAAARAAGQAGAKAFNEGRYAEAVDYFDRAESIMHAPTLLLHLARSHAKLGHFVKAREAYIKVTREQLAPDAPQAFRDAQESARQELPQVSAKVAKLTLTVSGPSSPSRVTIDGEEVPAEIVGVPFPVDPGRRTIEVTAEGYQPATQVVELQPGSSGSATLTLSRVPGTGAPGTSVEPMTATDQGTPSSSGTPADAGGSQGVSATRIAAYASLGVGAIGVGVGTVFLLKRSGLKSDADDEFARCVADGNGSCSDAASRSRVKDLDNDAAAKGTVAAVSYVVGGVGIAAGITLLLLGDSGDSGAASLTPYLTGSGAGVVGRF